MPTMAPALARLPAALFVALLTALVFGAVVGVATASNGSGTDGSHLAIPMPSVGDQWSYQAVLEGPWSFGDDDPQSVGVPFTFAEFAWHTPRLVRDGEGAEVAVDHLQGKTLFHLPLPKQAMTPNLWLTENRGYDFEVDTNAVDVYVGYLRRKLEAEGEPRLLHTLRGVGYALREPR